MNASRVEIDEGFPFFPTERAAGLEMKRPCILIIEDDREMRSLLEEFLKEEGFEVDSIGDGSEALSRVYQRTFDLVITDLWIGDVSGLSILPVLKKIRPRIPVIAITAFGSEEVRRRALDRGADAYLEKPLQLEELKSLMDQMISSPKKE
jgi:two-component system, NtrC family, response regulator HydG